MTRVRFAIAIFAAVLVHSASAPGLAQSPSAPEWMASPDQFEDQSQWYSEVVGANDNIVRLGGPFASYQEAELCSRKWSLAHPDDLRLTREREVVKKIRKSGVAATVASLPKAIEDATDAVAKAKRLLETGTTAAERGVGDTLKEYGDQIAEAWKRTVEFKKTLTAETNAGLDQLNKANKLIDSYNASALDFNRRARGSDLIPAPMVSRVTVTPKVVVTPPELAKPPEPPKPTEPPPSLYVADLVAKSYEPAKPRANYELWTAVYSASRSVDGRYATIEKARAAGKAFLKKHRGKQPQYLIRKGGRDLEGVDFQGKPFKR